MKAQEYLQKNQVSETNQNRLLAAQDENERRNAAREAMAEQRFTQAQKTDAARMMQQDEIQAQNLAHQQFLEKFNMQKEANDEAQARLKAEADAKKEARAIEDATKKETAAEARRIASGKIGMALAGFKGLLSDQQARSVADAYIEGTPEEQAGIVRYLGDLGKHKTAKSQYDKMVEALSIVDQSEASPEGWFRAGDVWVDKDSGPGVIPSLVSTKIAKKNPAWKIISTDTSGQRLIGDVPVVEPEEPKLTFGGLISSDTMPKVPNPGTSPMVPPPAAAPVPPAAVAAPVAPMAPTPTQYTEAEFRAEMQRRRPDVPIEAAVATARQRGIIR
jgi:hypothetical protein